MTKPTITRSYGQIHFEDLDPKRFEDLIRQLIYDFKVWQNIEATGRGGSDDGFDIRAFEKSSTSEFNNDEVTDELVIPNGNEWMIQCKREQTIGPAKIKAILTDIDPANPPYGYILAAACDVSKKSYDVFRETLRNLGVMEFFLWNKATLEDMLYQPKNDRILFTFFGISLNAKRRMKSTEIRSFISMKNKVLSLFKESHLKFFQKVLIRDAEDDHYPYESEYVDFNDNPKWQIYTAFEQHPLGLLFHDHEYFAYYNPLTDEYDYTTFIDDKIIEDDDWGERSKKLDALLPFYNSLPSFTKARLRVDSLVRYKDLLVVDPRGDSWNDMPHLYVRYENGSPFFKSRKFLMVDNEEIEIEDLKRIEIFPERFDTIKGVFIKAL